MSKITFRADDDLIRQLEEFDASKSEIMRKALREYLGESSAASTPAADSESLDDIVAKRVDAIIADRLDTMFTPNQPQDVNVNITLDAENAGNPGTGVDDVNTQSDASDGSPGGVSRTTDERMTDDGSMTDNGSDSGAPANERKTCSQCGEILSQSHVYCPNCGDKSAHRVFCECGDEIRSDWGFCPNCGRRTPAADVLD